MTPAGGFRRVGEREIWKGVRTGISLLTVEGPDGSTFERELVHHQDAVAVVPLLDNGAVVLVRQYRAAIDDWVLEIPAGLCDVDGEALEATARRELVEEVGYEAGTLEQLTAFHNAVGSTALKTTVYLGSSLTACPSDLQGPEELAMTVEHLPLSSAAAAVRDGRITDAKTVIGLLLVLAR